MRGVFIVKFRVFLQILFFYTNVRSVGRSSVGTKAQAIVHAGQQLQGSSERRVFEMCYEIQSINIYDSHTTALAYKHEIV